MTQPSLEPVEELILQDIETALGTISTTDPSTEYWHTVEKVTRAQQNIGTGSIFPAINVWPAQLMISDDLDGGTHAINTESMFVVAEGWLDVAENVPRALHRMNRDIRTALMLDPTRGARAIHTFVTKADFWFPESHETLAVVDCEIMVQYRTEVDSLETPR
jgi:hypothetical protein